MTNTLRNSLTTSALLAAAMMLATPAFAAPPACAVGGCELGETVVVALDDDDDAYAAIDAAIQEAVPGIEIEDAEEVMPGVYAVFGTDEAEENFYVVLVTEEGRVLGVEEETWDEDEDWDHEGGEGEGHDEDWGEDEEGDWDDEGWDEEDEAAWAAEMEEAIARLPEAVRGSADALIEESGESLEIVEAEEVMDGVYIIVAEGEEEIGIAMILADGEVISTDSMTYEEMAEWEDMDDEDWDDDMDDEDSF